MLIEKAVYEFMARGRNELRGIVADAGSLMLARIDHPMQMRGVVLYEVFVMSCPALC